MDDRVIHLLNHLIYCYYFIILIFILFIYLFLAVSSQLQHMGSLVQHAGFSLPAVHGLQACGVYSWQHMGSLVEAHRLSSCSIHKLSCLMACGILTPQGRIKPMSLALEGRFLTTEPPWKSPYFIILNKLAFRKITTKYFFFKIFTYLNILLCCVLAAAHQTF